MSNRQLGVQLPSDMFTNQPNTLPLPDAVPMKARKAKHAQVPTETQGRPLGVSFRKTFGALPFSARLSVMV